MNIIRTRPASTLGPDERFEGVVWIDEIAVNPRPSRLRAYSVHFSPAARTAWHRHPFGQVIHVTEGLAVVQCRGEAAEAVPGGTTVQFAPGEEHWHGAAPSSFMTHLAMQEVADDGVDADWGELVTDDEYARAAAPNA